MHVAISFRWPKKVLPIVKEVEVIVHVYPTGIGLGKYMCSLPGFAISEIQRQFGLNTRHGFHTQASSIRQPLGAQNVFKGFVVYLNPGGAVVSEFGYP